MSKCHCCQTFNVESAEPETRSLLSADQASWYTFCNDTYNVRTYICNKTTNNNTRLHVAPERGYELSRPPVPEANGLVEGR